MMIVEVQIDAGRELRAMACRYRGVAACATDPTTRHIIGRLARKLEARAESIWTDGFRCICQPDASGAGANDNGRPP
jgi:hypothetical protein